MMQELDAWHLLAPLGHLDTVTHKDEAIVDSHRRGKESKDRLSHLVELLDERAADIIRSRYGLVDGRQHKLADIGTKHGISAERVRQLEREALAKLRQLADPDLAA